MIQTFKWRCGDWFYIKKAKSDLVYKQIRASCREISNYVKTKDFNDKLRIFVNSTSLIVNIGLSCEVALEKKKELFGVTHSFLTTSLWSPLKMISPFFLVTSTPLWKASFLTFGNFEHIAQKKNFIFIKYIIKYLICWFHFSSVY